MKYAPIKYLIWIFITCSGTGLLTAQETFQRALGTSGDEAGCGIIAIPGNRLLILSKVTFSDKSGIKANDDDIVLIQTDMDGLQISTKRIRIEGDQYPYSMIKTNDNGFVISGHHNNTGDQQNFLMKLDENLDVRWTKLISHQDDVRFHLLRQGPDGSIFYGADVFMGAFPDILLMKFDQSGNKVWQKTWGLSNNDHIYDIHFAGDGRLYVIASIWTGSSAELVLFCLDENGQSIFTKSLFNDKNYYPRTFLSLGNNNTMLIGRAHYPSETALVIFNEDFDVTGTKLVSGSQGELLLESGVVYNDQVFLVGNISTKQGDIAVLCMETDGGINWLQTYGGSSEEGILIRSSESILAASGSLYFVGNTASFGSGGDDIYFVKTDLNGNSGCNETQINTTSVAMFENSRDENFDTNFEITISDFNASTGPSDELTATVLCPNTVIANFTSDRQKACIGGLINFTDKSENDPDGWYWAFEGGTPASSTDQNPQNILYQNPGIYDVMLVASSSGFSDTLVKEEFIEIVPEPIVNLGQDTLIPAGDQIMLDAGNPDAKFLWSTGDTTQTIMAGSENTYWVEINAFGCFASDTITIGELPPCVLALPTAFSPNGDGKNDMLRVRGENYIDFELHLFDRWGKMVFSSDEGVDGWDGNIDGKPAPVGVYNYYISGICVGGIPIQIKGTITLLR